MQNAMRLYVGCPSLTASLNNGMAVRPRQKHDRGLAHPILSPLDGGGGK